MNVFETNVAGVSNVTEAFLSLLRKSGEDKTKKILNMSSIIGSIAVIASINPGSQASAYAVSKAALNMLTKMTATLLAKENFIVYASHPGWVKTDMGGESAPIEPVDSIAGMLNVIDNLTPEQNGAFIDFQGKEVAW
jgi:NAD(P)-dependent dehydrogenase (short-subunit alcohol dehydrogenase family)